MSVYDEEVRERRCTRCGYHKPESHFNTKRSHMCSACKARMLANRALAETEAIAKRAAKRK